MGSSTNYRQCPKGQYPEFALIGRSNVGKSSLVNMLLGRKHLAKVSSRPGKTQLINHFLVDKAWYLVDLPGYGWAQASQAQRASWQKMASNYLLHRAALASVLVLVDARLQPQAIDIAWINWLADNQIPLAILLTKADKVSQQQVQAHLTALKQVLCDTWAVLPQFLVTSAHKQTGQQAVLALIQNIVGQVTGRNITDTGASKMP